MNLHSDTQTPSTPSFLFYSYSIEVKWENGRGAWGRQMHPNLSAAVIEPRLLAILAGHYGLFFLYRLPIAPLRNGMDEMVTMVIEGDQKKILDGGQQRCLRESVVPQDTGRTLLQVVLSN